MSKGADLLGMVEAGVHFGHHKSITFPKAKKFIHSLNKGISIINLEDTSKQIDAAKKMLAQVREDNQGVLVVGTKRQLRPIVKELAETSKLFYVTERWFGGFLTNFETFIGDIKKMNELETRLADDTVKMSKKERLVENRKLTRFKRFLSGVSDLKDLPQLMIVASVSHDKIAVAEAGMTGVQIIGITDTDCNPELVDIAIPANDDSSKSVRYILESLLEVEEPKAAKAEVKAEEETEEAEPVKKTVKKATKTEKAEEDKPKAKKTTKTTKTKKGE